MTAPNIEGVTENVILNNSYMGNGSIPYFGGIVLGQTSGATVAAGNLGQHVTVTASAVSITTSATSQNVASLALTAGIWLVEGVVQLVPAGSTTTTTRNFSISTTSATPGPFQAGITLNSAVAAGLGDTDGTPPVYINTTGQTVYLVANVTFATSTMSSNAFIRAIRIA